MLYACQPPYAIKRSIQENQNIKMKNFFKTKEAKRRIAKKDLENEKLPLWKRILALFKIAFTAVGKQD